MMKSLSRLEIGSSRNGRKTAKSASATNSALLAAGGSPPSS